MFKVQFVLDYCSRTVLFDSNKGFGPFMLYRFLEYNISMEIKQFIKEKLLTKNPNRLNGNLFKGDLEFSKRFWAKYQKEAEILKNETKNCQGGRREQHPYNEACYRILHDITDVIKCKCGNPVNYHTFATGYHEFCSAKCQGGGIFEEERICGICSKLYLATNRTQKYCSDNCGRKARELTALDAPYSHNIKMIRRDILKLIKETPNCEICNIKLENNETSLSKSAWFNVDHCHETGKVRGILCSKCNIGLGMFKDNIASLKTAIKYLKQTKE